MPELDVDDVLLDIDFVDCSLICYRQPQTVTSGGMGVNTSTPTAGCRFAGVVTSEGGKELDRLPEGERLSQRILIVTKFRLTTGQPGFSADIVQWNLKKYTVVRTDDYSRYGRGFIQATCELIPQQG